MALDTVDTTNMAVELGIAISRLRGRMRKEMELPSAGWTIPHLTVLRRVIENGPITTSALSKSEHVRPQSMAETVNALRAAGLLEGRSDPADGRRRLLTATVAGRCLLASVQASKEAWLSRAIDHVLDSDERRVLDTAVELLNRLADSSV
jgi:DNA-binding MarR family transcriptional regulator